MGLGCIPAAVSMPGSLQGSSCFHCWMHASHVECCQQRATWLSGVAACDLLLQATEGNDADAAAAGPSQADETVLGAATGSAAAGIAAAAGGLAAALGGREQLAAAPGVAVAAPGVAATAAAPAAAAPVPAKAPEIDLLGGDDVYVPNGE